MSVGKLATALTVIFAVSVVVLVAELLFVLRRRRSSQPPVSGDEQRPHHLLTSDYSAKQLLCFFCLKSQTRVEPSSGAPTQNPDESPSEDPVIDVFKLLESNGPSRVLCTIKEDDDREDIEVAAAATTEKVSLQACLESEAEEEMRLRKVINVEEVEGTNTVFSSPCDSPMFFTPMGSPSRGATTSEFVSPVTGNRCDWGRSPVKGCYGG